MSKKIILIFGLLISTALISNAQQIEFFPFAGYTFADEIPIEQGVARIEGGITYGGIVSFKINKSTCFELTYSRMDASATATSAVPGFIEVTDQIDVNYIFAGLIKTFKVAEKIELFAGLNLGAGIIASKNDKFASMTKFSIGANAGAKYVLTEKLALRFQAFINTPVTDEGGTIWWSSGSGTTAGSTSYLPLIQFGLTGGIVFTLK